MYSISLPRKPGTWDLEKTTETYRWNLECRKEADELSTGTDSVLFRRRDVSNRGNVSDKTNSPLRVPVQSMAGRTNGVLIHCWRRSMLGPTLGAGGVMRSPVDHSSSRGVPRIRDWR